MLDSGEVKTLAIFVAAALAELAGTYAVWRWLREGSTPLLAQPIDRCPVSRGCLKQQLDLVQREARPLRRLDHGQRADDAGVVHAPTANARRPWQEPDLLVVANRGRTLSGQLGHGADSQLW